MLDRFIYRCCGFLDKFTNWMNGLFAPRCKCKRKKKNA